MFTKKTYSLSIALVNRINNIGLGHDMIYANEYA
jgi:hypothetical protein